jgi:hypothetical protein
MTNGVDHTGEGLHECEIWHKAFTAKGDHQGGGDLISVKYYSKLAIGQTGWAIGLLKCIIP